MGCECLLRLNVRNFEQGVVDFFEGLVLLE